jgi:ribokinase
MTGHIVVLGSVNADLVLRCERLPGPGETVHGREFKVLPGGKGANQAVAAARLGAAVSFIGCVGADDHGREARRRLAAEGIELTHLAEVAQPTGVAMILVDDRGQNSIALSAGANAALGVAQVDAAAALIGSAALLVCQLESPLAAVARAMAIAHAAGVPVLLNPAPAQALPAALLRQVDILVPNESEAAVLLGAALAPADAAARLRERGPATVIVTLGADGVQCADEHANLHAPAPRTRAVDTTGAGDTFIGAFAAARCAGAALHAAIAHAQQAAAFSVARPGTIDAMPYARDLQPALTAL